MKLVASQNEMKNSDELVPHFCLARPSAISSRPTTNKLATLKQNFAELRKLSAFRFLHGAVHT